MHSQLKKLYVDLTLPVNMRCFIAGFVFQSRVFIFGGRLLDNRMNDMYALDLDSMSWSENLNGHNAGSQSLPSGRSWHSFTLISPTSAILYGGLSSEGQVLGDCWIYHIEKNVWSKLQTTWIDR